MTSVGDVVIVVVGDCVVEVAACEIVMVAVTDSAAGLKSSLNINEISTEDRNEGTCKWPFQQKLVKKRQTTRPRYLGQTILWFYCLATPRSRTSSSYSLVRWLTAAIRDAYKERREGQT